MPYIKRAGLTKNLAFAVCAAVFGSAFQHGYNIGVVNAPQQLVMGFINATMDERGKPTSEDTNTLIWSVIVGIYCVGGMIGGLLTAVVGDKFGRKGGLLINNIFVFIGVALMACSKLAKSYEMIIAGRFVIGINSGLNAGLCPMFLNEISPTHLRGAIGTTYQLIITISILLSQVVGLPQICGTEELWPLLFAIAAIPGVLQLCTLTLCPETPKFLLLNRGKDIQAQEALTWYRGDIDIHDELDEVKNEGEAMKLVPKVTLKEIVTNPTLRAPLIIASVVMLAQQFSGINAVMFFSTQIFKSAGLNEQNALYATLTMGTINVVMTIISLIIVEKAGRKTLLLVGFVVMDVITLLLTICLEFKDSAVWVSYVAVVMVNLFVIMFATGPGSVPWFLVTEMFNQGARPIATSIAVCLNWFASTVIGVLFLPLANATGSFVFLFFTAILAASSVFIYFKLPETKGKTIEEINKHFREKSYQ